MSRKTTRASPAAVVHAVPASRSGPHRSLGA